jgi:hypothetical protein
VNLALILLLRDRFGVAGLAIAFSAAAVVQVIGLAFFLRQRRGPMEQRAFWVSVGKTTAASFAFLAAAYPVRQWLGTVYPLHTFLQVAAQFSASVFVGTLVFIGVAKLVRSEEVEDIPTSQPLTGRGYGAKAFANETGNLSVVAYNAENHQLEIFDHSGAYNNFASWQKAVIETVGSLVQDTSVAIDSSGLTAIAYYDDVSKVLKVATRPGVGQPFVIQTAISGGNIGNDNSIAIRASDKAIGVSGYDNDLQGLRFALRDSAGVWQDSELVNVDNDSGRASSLVFTDDGIPNITHYQLVYGDLMLSRRKVAP